MVSTMKRIAALSLLMGIAAAVSAQGMGGQGMMGGQQMKGESVDSLIGGEIRRVDKEAKKLTIRHGAIPKMDMPPMTMVYQVKDPAILDQVKAGDKIRFEVDNVDGTFVVTRIEATR